jgi:predicted acetyltransferase
VGQVAVDLLHKKERVAKEMITFFARHYLERGASMLLLYPFRPDFYKKMGFGFGAKISQYRLRTAALPRGPSKKHIRFGQPADKEAILACYERYVARTHGMISRDGWEVDRHFESPTTNIVVVERDDRVFGYVVFTFERGETFLDNQLRVVELIYEDPAALSEILTFLNTQADQVEWTVIPSHDGLLHHLVDDPRNDSDHIIPSVYHETNTQGVGLMYRVINAAGLFQRLHDYNFGGESLKLQITFIDTFLPDQEDSMTVNFERGHARVTDSVDHDVAIKLDIADFSSLVMGVIPFSRLHNYGLVEISDPAYVGHVDRLFRAQQGPVCLSSF